MHSGTQTPRRHPIVLPHATPAAPLQSRSATESHASGAPGNARGSLSSQSHRAPAGAHAHAGKPSPSSSAHAAPASQPGPAAARAIGGAPHEIAHASAVANKRNETHRCTRRSPGMECDCCAEARDCQAVSTSATAARPRQYPRACHGPTRGGIGFPVRARLLVRSIARAALRPTLPLALASSSGLAGCGEDPAAPVPFTVWAFEERSGLADALTPLAGAEASFDPPGGGARMLGTVAEDGHVTFVADFQSGGGTVSVFDRDHVLVSRIGASPGDAPERPIALGKPAGDLVLFAPRLDEAVRRTSVEVKGALLSKRHPQSSIDLSASGVEQLGALETSEASYSLRAPRGRPFFILGHETSTLANAPQKVDNDLLGSFRIDMPALDADATRDIDLPSAKALSTRTVRVRAELPRDALSPFGDGTRATVTVVSADSEVLLGPVKSAQPSADGRAFDLAMYLAETDIAPERPLTRASLVAGDGSRSIRIEPGVAPDGATWSEFLLPPMATPSPAPIALTDPITFGYFPPGADIGIEVYAGTQLAWIIEGSAQPPTAPIKLPVPLEVRLPALVAVSFIARTDRVPLAPRGDIYRRTAISRDVIFRR